MPESQNLSKIENKIEKKPLLPPDKEKYLKIGAIICFIVLALSALIYFGYPFYQNKYYDSKIDSYNQLIDTSKEQINEQNYSSAIKNLNLALESLPQESQAYILLAQIYLSKNYTSRAIELLELALPKVNQKEEVLQTLALSHYNLQQYDQALSYYEKLISQYNHQASYFYYISSLIKNKQTDLALQNIDNVSETNPDYNRIVILKTLLNYDKLEVIEAELNQLNVDQVLESDPDWGPMIQSLVKTIAKVKKENDENSWYLKTVMAEYSNRFNHPELAISIITPFVEEVDQEKFSDPLLVLAQAYALKEDWSSAQAPIDQAVIVKTNSYTAYWLAGYIYTKLNDQSQAIDYYKIALDLAPNSKINSLRLEYAAKLHDWNMLNEEQQQYETILKSKELSLADEIEATNNLVDLLIYKGQYKDANQYLSDISKKKEAKESNLYSQLLCQKGRLLDKLKQPSASQDVLNQCLEINAKDACCLLTSATFDLDNNQTESVREKMIKAVDYDTTGKWAHLAMESGLISN